MRALIAYFREMTVLIGRASAVLWLVLAMGVGLGVMDLICLALLAKMVGGVSQNLSHIALLPSHLMMPVPLLHVGVLLVAIYLVRALVGVSFNFAIFRRTGSIEAQLRARMIERFMLMSHERRLKRPLGSLVTSANQWTMSFVRGVLAPLLRFTCDALVGMLILAYFLVLYPVAVLVFFGVALTLGMLYDRTLRRLAMQSAKKFRQVSEEIAESTEQALAGYKEIRVLRLAGFFRAQIYQQSTAMGRALAISNTIGQSPRLMIEAMLVIIGVSLLLYLAHSGLNIADQLPEMAMLTFALLRVSSLVSLATATVANLRLYRGVVHQLYTDICEDMVVDTPLSAATQRSEFVALEASELSFCYQGGNKNILDHLNFKIAAGEAVAIVGDSGAGKTTLVDLLLGILEPTSGHIRVLMHQHSQTRTQTNLVGLATYLSQNSFLLNDTLRRNVALGVLDDDIDDMKIVEALTKAKLPQLANQAQFDAMVGDRGAKLSGGQRQRVVLARAFYHGHKVMVLDEATNAIDLATETEIVQDLLDLRPDITLIAITHRPEIAKLFPRTLHLKSEVRS